MNKLAASFVALFACVGAANATMPPLSEMPNRRTDANCWAWAEREAESDEEISEMWGLLDTGDIDKRVAVKRLADQCLGKPVPEIVYFYSSVGFQDSYCKRYSAQKICRMRKK